MNDYYDRELSPCEHRWTGVKPHCIFCLIAHPIANTIAEVRWAEQHPGELTNPYAEGASLSCEQLEANNRELKDRYIELEKRNAELYASSREMNRINELRFEYNIKLKNEVKELEAALEDTQDELISIRGF